MGITSGPRHSPTRERPGRPGILLSTSGAPAPWRLDAGLWEQEPGVRPPHPCPQPRRGSRGRRPRRCGATALWASEQAAAPPGSGAGLPVGSTSICPAVRRVLLQVLPGEGPGWASHCHTRPQSLTEQLANTQRADGGTRAGTEAEARFAAGKTRGRYSHRRSHIGSSKPNPRPPPKRCFTPPPT